VIVTLCLVAVNLRRTEKKRVRAEGTAGRAVHGSLRRWHGEEVEGPRPN
jgi:predicted metalloprotease